MKILKSNKRIRVYFSPRPCWYRVLGKSYTWDFYYKDNEYSDNEYEFKYMTSKVYETFWNASRVLVPFVNISHDICNHLEMVLNETD